MSYRLARRADVLLVLDPFTQEVWTATGLRTAYVLSAIHLPTRQVVLADATFSHNSLWMRQTGRDLLMVCEDPCLAPQIPGHDRDKLLAHDLDVALGRAGLETVLTAFRVPDASAHAERWTGLAHTRAALVLGAVSSRKPGR